MNQKPTLTMCRQLLPLHERMYSLDDSCFGVRDDHKWQNLYFRDFHGESKLLGRILASSCQDFFRHGIKPTPDSFIPMCDARNHWGNELIEFFQENLDINRPLATH